MQKINIDNKFRFGYLDGYCYRIFGVSIYVKDLTRGVILLLVLILNIIVQ